MHLSSSRHMGEIWGKCMFVYMAHSGETIRMLVIIIAGPISGALSGARRNNRTLGNRNRNVDKNHFLFARRLALAVDIIGNSVVFSVLR